MNAGFIYKLRKSLPKLDYSFPDNKKFVFTILDDCDDATTENVVPVYDYLTEKGLFITKTVWPQPCPEGSRLFFAGKTLEDTEHLKAVKRISLQGHEIASHCATMESSRRNRIEQGLAFFKREFGSVPKVFCSHGHNLDNMYWGEKRYRNPLLVMMHKFSKRSAVFQGDVKGSEYFWGDLHKKYHKFTRNLTFVSDLNVLNLDSSMPYIDSQKPFSNFWFSTADAPDANHFRNTVTKEKIDRLEREGGVCILSTHLGKQYCVDGTIDPYLIEIINYISKKPGWFAPVGQVLEFLLAEHPDRAPITAWQLYKLEFNYLLDRLKEKMNH